MRFNLREVNTIKHAHHEVRPRHVLPVFTEIRRHDRRGFKRAMPRASAFHIRVVVGVFGERLIAHIGSIVHELEHFGRFLEVDIDHLLGHILAK